MAKKSKPVVENAPKNDELPVAESMGQNVRVVNSMAEANAVSQEEAEEGEMIKIKKDEVVPTTVVRKGRGARNPYKFIRNVKYKGTRYQVGDEIEAEGEDLEMLIKNNLIQ